ncbi:MAG: hypothetical protein HW421_2163 [Ignavibacteria bacterium]|nr:hypothetical protein [Ignavibacteria bacterium]
MKKLFLLILFLFVSNLPAFSQLGWYKQYTPGNHQFFSIFFLDTLNGWIGCENGYLLRTTNGGKDWNEIKTPISNLFATLHFFDTKNGLSTMQFSTESKPLYQTTDGGNTWVNNKLYEGGMVCFDMFFLNKNTGFIAGKTTINAGSRTPTVLKTVDGGKNWNPVYMNDYAELYCIFFANSMNGWAAGSDYGYIYNTTDGGNSWSKDILPKRITGNIKGLSFISAQEGWAILSWRNIYHTENGGNVWTIQDSTYQTGLNCIEFFDSNNGWIVGGQGNSNVILYTTNKGESWTQQKSQDSKSPLIKVTFPGKYKGWAIASNGTLLFTRTGGKTENSLPNVSINGTGVICEGDTNELIASPDGNQYTYTWSTGEKTKSVKVTKGGLYSVLVEDNTGKLGYAEINITSNAKPEFTIEYKPTDFLCAGDSVELSCVQEFPQYQWSNGETGKSFYAKKPGIYKLVVTDTNGCHGTDSIKINGMSDLTELKGDTSLTFGQINVGSSKQQNIKIENNSFESIGISSVSLRKANTVFKLSVSKNVPLWLKPGDSLKITITFKPTQSGALSDTLIVTFDSPCNEEMKLSLQGSGYSGVEDSRINESDIKIIPNPTTGKTEIHFECTEQGKVGLKITDITGKIVYQSIMEKNSKEMIFEFDASRYANGTYYFTILFNEETLSKGNFVVSH